MWLNWWMVCRVIWVLVPPVISWPTHCSWQHSTLHGVRRISHCPNILQMVYFRRLPTDSHYARMTTFVELERLHVHTKKTIRQNRDKTNKHKIREWKVFSQSISNWNSTRQTVYIDSISFGALFLAKFAALESTTMRTLYAEHTHREYERDEITLRQPFSPGSFTYCHTQVLFACQSFCIYNSYENTCPKLHARHGNGFRGRSRCE